MKQWLRRKFDAWVRGTAVFLHEQRYFSDRLELERRRNAELAGHLYRVCCRAQAQCVKDPSPIPQLRFDISFEPGFVSSVFFPETDKTLLRLMEAYIGERVVRSLQIAIAPYQPKEEANDP